MNISIVHLFNYMVRKTWFTQTKDALSLYDSVGDGTLMENDLENYIEQLMTTLPQLNALEETYYPFYFCIAVRKFFFFLDPHKSGKIKITDILESGFLDDILEVRIGVVTT